LGNREQALSPVAPLSRYTFAMTKPPHSPDAPADTTHFGFRDVPVAEKQKLVGEVFSSVAGNYDLMNDLMSLGIHRVWKRYFVATAQVRPGDRVLDLAGGTGDIAALLKDRVGADGGLVLGDINGAMLRVGRDRMTDRGNVRGFEYVQCNAEKLPFPDASFDLVTIAFGLRNVTDKDAALREMHRVLRIGGQARVLEFSEVKADGSNRFTTSTRSRYCRSWASCSPTTATAINTSPNRSASIRRRIN
jgi:demethylmenaquinone methyltransferase / 2-methoxy-6-polyprenyl-1,4-benzoquinol methylase